MKEYKLFRLDDLEASNAERNVTAWLSTEAAEGWRVHTLTSHEDGFPHFALLERERGIPIETK